MNIKKVYAFDAFLKVMIWRHCKGFSPKQSNKYNKRVRRIEREKRRMTHQQRTLSSLEGFGGISSCSCGIYHVHLPGLSVHLNEKGFDRLIQMVLEAKENKDLYRLNEEAQKKNHLKIVKT